LIIPYFAGPLNLTEYCGYRLSEQSVHAWDVHVALEPAASIPPDELDLLWRRLDLIASRFHDRERFALLRAGTIELDLDDTHQRFWLKLNGQLHLVSENDEPAYTRVSGTSDALLRLFYGRHRPQDDLNADDPTTLRHLISLFPGF
jgi:hypothetical protein